jgi:hypothetical protein
MKKQHADVNDTLRDEGIDAVRGRNDKARRYYRADENPANQELPVIQVRAGALHEIASEAEAALIAASAPLYARDGEIVRPIVEEVAAFKGRRTKIARLKPVTIDMIRDHLSRAARWEKRDGRSKKMIRTDPPPDVAKIILARDGDAATGRQHPC